MKYLLEKLGVLSYKYGKIKEEENFNIFSILRDVNDEVNLHSRLIFELLDRNGSHGQGTKFVKALMDEIQIANFDFNEYVVHREYKNIDILLTSFNHAIVIENKIWADDKDRQLERYSEVIKREGYDNIQIFYLTLDGKEPANISLGKLNLEKDVKLISYSFHIKNWIEECIRIVSRNPALRETLIQYQKIINQLTGKTMSEEQKNEIIDLLRENDNIVKAQLIAENWSAVKWQTEFEFWCDFEELISEQYEILQAQKFSEKHLNSVIYQLRNRNYWYGIMFKIAEFKTADMCLFIERGNHELYYGITMVNQKGREISNDADFSEFSEFLKNNTGCNEREEYWLGWKYFTPYINFEKFSDSTTLKLINKQHRIELLLKYWKEIQDFVIICVKEVDKRSPLKL